VEDAVHVLQRSADLAAVQQVALDRFGLGPGEFVLLRRPPQGKANLVAAFGEARATCEPMKQAPPVTSVFGMARA